MHLRPHLEVPNAYVATVSKHLERFFGVEVTEHVWDQDLIQKTVPGFRVLHVKPNEENNHHTYITCGLPGCGSKTELAISSPFATKEHVELGSMLASVLTARTHSYALGDIIRIGRPWIYGAVADSLLVSHPFPYGPNFENFYLENEGGKILWLMPIFSSEADYAAKNGVEALEKLFDQNCTPFLEPRRRAVVQ